MDEEMRKIGMLTGDGMRRSTRPRARPSGTSSMLFTKAGRSVMQLSTRSFRSRCLGLRKQRASRSWLHHHRVFCCYKRFT
jgi:hypothetical protein